MTTGTLPHTSSSLRDDGKVCAYGQDHAEVEEWAASLLQGERDVIGIEKPWSALVRVVCPSTLIQGQKAFEASIEWDSEVWFARITLVCNLPFLLRQWALIHEMMELKFWKTGDAFHNLLAMLPPSELRDLLQHQFYVVRNQEIEQEVGGYLGYRRPNHIVSVPLPVREEKHEKVEGPLFDLLHKWEQEDAQSLPTSPESISLMTPEEFLNKDNEEEEPWPNLVELTEEEMENIRL